jgi:hypothetical protein
MLDMQRAKNQDFMFCKTFADGNYVASGYLKIPKGTEKPNKNSKEAAMVFLVMKGVVTVTIHRTSVKMGPQGQFCVPPGIYSIEY